MKSLFNKKAKKTFVKVTEISKAELKNVIGGADTTSSLSATKISSDKIIAFFHS